MESRQFNLRQIVDHDYRSEGYGEYKTSQDGPLNGAG